MNINIQFVKDGSPLFIQANSNDLIAEVVMKYLQKIGMANEGNLKFFYNSKQLGLYDGKTLSDYQMYNNATIQVTTGFPQPMNFVPQQNQPNINQFNPNFGNMGSAHMNIIFVINGRKIMVQGQPTTKFCELAQRFSTKADLKQNDIPKYILNSMQVPPNDQRTLTQLKLRDQSRIEVFLEQEVIGA